MGVAIKTAISVSECPCTNLTIWSFRKDVLKNFALDFIILVLKQQRLASYTLSYLLPLETL